MAKVLGVSELPRLPWRMMDVDGCAEMCLMKLDVQRRSNSGWVLRYLG